NVTIAGGETRDIALSPLGRRRKLAAEGEPGSLRIVCVPEDCAITFREKDRLTHDDMIDRIPAGRYPIVASRGAKTLRNNVDVPSGMFVTIEANFATGVIRVIDTRRRARRLEVAEANDPLSSLVIPGYWKSAIHSVLPAGVSVVQAIAVEPNGVRATLRVPSTEVGWALIESVAESQIF